MTTFVFANNVDTTLASSISSSATTITLSSGTNLPTLAAGQTFVVTLNDAATQQVFEVMYATAISSTTLTVSRAQEGTTAQAWAAGDYVFSGPTAGQMRAFYQGQSVGQGTVTSVGMSMPSGFSVSGSPITVAGTLGVTFASQNAGLFLATPVTGGSAGAASWRSLAAADVNGALGYTSANDGEVVHIAGTETITGTKTFNGTVTTGAIVATSNAIIGGPSFVVVSPSASGGQVLFRPNGQGSSSGQCSVSSAGAFTCVTFNASASDRRLKKNIHKVKPRPLHRHLQFVSFELRENGWVGLGEVAQRVLPLAPEHVGEFEKNGKTYYSLNYAGMAYEQAVWASREVDRLTLRVAKLERALAKAKIEPRKRGFCQRLWEVIW